MRTRPQNPAPSDAATRRSAPPVIVYTVDKLPPYDRAFYDSARRDPVLVCETIVPPREARTFMVPAGHLFRIVSIEGPQVGDLNLWNAHDLSERFFSGKTRALHATHVTTGDRLWSTLPHLRPMATITHDTLSWYGFDADGGGVHDVIGTRCDPYTQLLLAGTEYHHCCHSNLTRALAAHTRLPLAEAERHIHDVLNVFMCTGFTRDTHQYFMQANGPATSSSSSPRSTCSARCPPVQAAIAAARIRAMKPNAIRSRSRFFDRAKPRSQDGGR